MRYPSLTVAGFAVLFVILLAYPASTPIQSPTAAAPLLSLSLRAYPIPTPYAWGTSMTYDAHDGYMLLLDGNRTWADRNGSWNMLRPARSPEKTNWYCLAYDPLAGYTVLFGGAHSGGPFAGIGFVGEVTNATWDYVKGDWTNITNDSGPMPALKYPACAYDPKFDGGAIVMFGGATSSYEHNSTTYLMYDTNQTWAYEKIGPKHFGWVQLHLVNSPPEMFGASMAYDTTTRTLVLYGGASNGTSTANGSCSPTLCPHFHTTYKLSGSGTSLSWKVLPSVYTPPGSVFGGLAYDATDGYLLYFGGQINGYKSLNATQNVTAAFESGHWVNLTGTTNQTPGTRFGEGFAFDPTAGSVFMFSGLSGTLVNSTICRDFWQFSDGTWSLTYRGDP